MTDIQLLDDNAIELVVDGIVQKITYIVWGEIGGKLSNQTDLQNELNGIDNSISGVEQIALNNESNIMLLGEKLEQGLQSDAKNNLYQKNAKAYGQNNVALGTSVAGSKAFSLNYIHTNAGDHTFETFNLNSVDGIEIGMEANIYIYDGTKDTNYMMIGVVQAIDGNDLLITTSIVDTSIDTNNLVNSYIWFTRHSDIGDIEIGTGAVAQGFETNAVQIGSHSEGWDTLALGKYSHAEGRGSIAGGYCSHAEGRDTKANGFYSFANNRDNQANGECSTATGQGTQANGYASFSGGTGTKANGSRAVAIGYNCEANATTSFASGANSKANHESSFVHGTRLESGRYNQVVFGRDNEVDADAIFVFGWGANQNSKRNTFTVYDRAIKVGDTKLTEAQLQQLLNLIS